MKKLILLAAFAIALGVSGHAQIQKIFDFEFNNDLQDPAFYEQPVEDGTYIYGMTEYGGAHNSGGIYRVKPDGTDFLKLHDFYESSLTNGSRPQGGLTLVGSVLYGMTTEGGVNNDGCIFKINTDGSGFAVLHNFEYATSGGNPKGTLTLTGGMLYGTANEGGTAYYGTLFRLDTDGSDFEVLYNFDLTSGSRPFGRVTPDGNLLYGTLSEGAGESSTGCLYKFDLSDNTFTVLHVFEYLTGATPYGSVTKVGNYLYGTASNGSYPSDGGVIFKFNLVNSAYNVVNGFSGDYGKPVGDMVQSGSKLYFIAKGSVYVSSYVCELDINTEIVTRLLDLENQTYGANHSQTNGSVLVIGNLLYVTGSGGPSGHGYMFSISKTGSEFIKRLIFRGTANGRFPEGNLIALGGYFYGMTPEGGTGEQGCIFRINQDGTGYTKLFDFNGINGRKPYGSLLYNEGALYGTASEGGDNGYGCVFRINPDGSGYTILHHFSEFEGNSPRGNLILSDGILYGTTNYGYSLITGTLFKINTDGTGFETLHSFNYDTDGGYPIGSLIKSGNKLFGMTPSGGLDQKGTIFSFDLAGSTFTVLHHFSGNEGKYPYGSLLLSGTSLYGMTSEGGMKFGGTLFSIETNGNAYTELVQFDNSASVPRGSLILNDGSLYGLTYYGGDNYSGAVFSYSIAQHLFTPLASFTGNNGLTPYGDLIMVGEDFYGMARNGGSNDRGVLFKYTTPIEWIGTLSNLWSEGDNWSRGSIPASAQDVVIPSSPANQPHVDLGVVSPAQCNKLTIEPGATVTIDPGKALTVIGNLINQAGNNGIVLESNASGTGSLIHNTSFVNATIKRYITGDADLTKFKYHLVSVPLADQDLTASVFNGSYLFEFDPGLQNWIGVGNDPQTPLYSNKGYMIYYPASSTTYNFAGLLHNGGLGYDLSQNANRYLLIPNPYPSAIDWDSPVCYKYELNDATWIWNPETGNYAAYGSQAGTNGGSRYIPQGQSFFVRATGNFSYFSMENTARVHNSQAFYKTPAITSNQLRIKAICNNYSDEALVRFTPEGLSGLDMSDVSKLTGNGDAPQLSTLVEGEKISINTLPELSGSVTIPVNFETSFSGQITLNFSQQESFPDLVPLYFVDETNSETINLRDQASYTFNYNPGDNSERFKLLIGGTTGIDDQIKNTGNIWIAEGSVFIHSPGATGENARLEIFNPEGRKTTDRSIVLNELTVVPVTASGMAIVRVTTAKESQVCKGIFNNR